MENKKERWLWFLIIILVWVSITNMIQAFACPKMTRTELFLNIPKCAILNFEHCK